MRIIRVFELTQPIEKSTENQTHKSGVTVFIAHLPAGYLLTKAVLHKTGRSSRPLMLAGLVASVFPDLDLFYFYLIDDRQTPHHHYITHFPLAWAALALVASSLLYVTGQRRHLIFVGVIFANLMLHMAADSIAAGIYWLYPFANIEVNLIEVPARYDFWVWNFILHPTFLFEMLIVMVAGAVWARGRR